MYIYRKSKTIPVVAIAKHCKKINVYMDHRQDEK